MPQGKLVIGTANFGARYGFSSKTSLLNNQDIESVLDFARRNSIKELDTAFVYEGALSSLKEHNLGEFKINSKVKILPNLEQNIKAQIKREVFFTLEQFSKKEINILHIHNPEILLTTAKDSIIECLSELKSQGYIKKIGVSIYSPKILDSLLVGFSPDVIQAPFNIFDQRIVNTGWAATLLQKKIEIHVRSIFLQGVLLKSEEELPNFFKNWNYVFSRWWSFLEQSSFSPLEVTMAQIKEQCWVSKIVVGVDSLMQLEEIAYASKKVQDLSLETPAFEIKDERLLDPSKWSSL